MNSIILDHSTNSNPTLFYISLWEMRNLPLESGLNKGSIRLQTEVMD